MNPLETYLNELWEVRASGAGAKETSYYGPLAHFLNEIGKKFKPKVKCIINLKNVGPGCPTAAFLPMSSFRNSRTPPPSPARPWPAGSWFLIHQDNAWVGWSVPRSPIIATATGKSM
ncbi:MAG: hypothetical protein FJ134_08160 [Deltaproteobacteria bacterium]|nr:hypothetical protein [Deltaproteobacteria bacterium]